MTKPTYQFKPRVDVIGEATSDLAAHVHKELGKRLGELITQYPELPKTHRFAGLSVEKGEDNTIIKMNFEPIKK